MKLKQTKLPYNKKVTFFMVVGLGLLLVLFTFAMQLVQEDGFEFSCINGTFSNLHLTRMPPMCVACFPTCFGHIETYVNSQLVCNSTQGVYDSQSIVIPCKGIKNFISKDAIVKYNINSSGQYFEGNVVVPIEYKK